MVSWSGFPMRSTRLFVFWEELRTSEDTSKGCEQGMMSRQCGHIFSTKKAAPHFWRACEKRVGSCLPSLLAALDRKKKFASWALIPDSGGLSGTKRL